MNYIEYMSLWKKSDRIIVAIIALIAWVWWYSSNESNMENWFAIVVNAIIIIPIAFFIYFYPSLHSKGKIRFWQVFVINLFFGWSILGWVVALVIALDKSNTPVAKTDKE